MNGMTPCPREGELLAALKSNSWTDDLRRHAAGCPYCQETITMTTLLQTGADAEHPLPSPRLLWLKAQYARKEDRLSAFDVVSLAGLSLAGIVALAALLFWRFPGMLGKIPALSGGSAGAWTNIVSTGSPLAVILGVLLLVMLLARDSFFAER